MNVIVTLDTNPAKESARHLNIAINAVSTAWDHIRFVPPSPSFCPPAIFTLSPQGVKKLHFVPCHLHFDPPIKNDTIINFESISNLTFLTNSLSTWRTLPHGRRGDAAEGGGPNIPLS